MNARIPNHRLPQQSLTTVFTSGNSQAVRLPKEYRFNTKQVTIERRGDEIVLREKKRSLGQALRDALGDLPPISSDEAQQMERVLAMVKDQGALEARAMWTDARFWHETFEPKSPSVKARQKSDRTPNRPKSGRS